MISITISLALCTDESCCLQQLVAICVAYKESRGFSRARVLPTYCKLINLVSRLFSLCVVTYEWVSLYVSHKHRIIIVSGCHRMGYKLAILSVTRFSISEIADGLIKLKDVKSRARMFPLILWDWWQCWKPLRTLLWLFGMMSQDCYVRMAVVWWALIEAF